MPEKLPRITAADLVRTLDRDGWQDLRQRGSHLHLTHPIKPGRVTVPWHSGVTLAPKTLQAILTQAGITADELRRLL
jgi:predicted RNA binding protein YcfA (HicA-like mRNA interferase family)